MRDDTSTGGRERTRFEEKVDAIATVLDEFPPMQILRAVQQLAEDPNSRMEPSDVRTTAANVSTDDELRSVIGLAETPDTSTTDTERGGDAGDE